MEENNYICPICGQKIKRGNRIHAKACVLNFVNGLTESKKKEIIHLYVEEEYSMVDMSNFFGFPYSTTTHILKELGLKRRTISDAKKQKKCKEKYKNTCLLHFGEEHNFSKNSESRKKWEKRLLETEGITNVFQRESVKGKIKKTMLKKYGEEGIFKNRSKGNFIEYYIEKYGEEKGIEKFNFITKRKREVNTKEYIINNYGEDIWEKHLEKLAKGFKHNSGLNDKCEKILNDNKIPYEREFVFPSSEYGYVYDFKINNILIELNGIYWHCSPKIYKPNDLVKFPNNKFIRAIDKWNYDKAKVQHAIDHGFDVIVIWEDEFSEKKLLEELKEKKYYGEC